MSKFIKVEDFLENVYGDWNPASIVQFFEENGITLNKFNELWLENACEFCSGSNFRVWRDDVLYDEGNQHFILEKPADIVYITDRYSDQGYESCEFYIYVCLSCNKWSTIIE